MATILISLVLLALFAAAAVYLIRSRKRGTCVGCSARGCGGTCPCCSPKDHRCE